MLSVLAHTGGWPAVIGLAALTKSPLLPTNTIPQALYEYFAEELYQAAEEGIRWGLCQTAIPPSIDRELANALFGERTSDLVLNEAVRLGILNPDREKFELHPLLRAFLQTKLREFGTASVRSVVSRVGTVLIERKSWDDAFFVADAFEDADLLTTLVTTGWEDLLSEGRVATLASWLHRADAAARSFASVRFRRGRGSTSGISSQPCRATRASCCGRPRAAASAYVARLLSSWAERAFPSSRRDRLQAPTASATHVANESGLRECALGRVHFRARA